MGTNKFKHHRRPAYNGEGVIGINGNVIKETGDHAVEWVFYYYTKNVEKLLLTRQRLLELMLTTSVEKGISLSTPLTIQQS